MKNKVHSHDAHLKVASLGEAAARFADTTVAADFGLPPGTDENALCDAIDWLLRRQAANREETRGAPSHGRATAFYDLSSSSYHGTHRS